MIPGDGVIAYDQGRGLAPGAMMMVSPGSDALIACCIVPKSPGTLTVSDIPAEVTATVTDMMSREIERFTSNSLLFCPTAYPKTVG